MTTIAVSKTDKGVLIAADTQVTTGFSKTPGQAKVFHPGGKESMMCGVAGDVRVGNIFKHILQVPPFTKQDHENPEKWFVTRLIPSIRKAVDDSGAMGKDDDKDSVDMRTVFVVPGAVAYIGCDLAITGLHHPFWAVGSGSDYAIGAMSAGKDAAEAVTIAGAHDLGTNTETMEWEVEW